MCPRDGGDMSDQFDFDEQLRSAFSQAEASVPDDGFAERVTHRLANPNRRRFLILGGAGSTGAAFSGTQLEGVFEWVLGSPGAADGWLGQLPAFVGPETLAAGVMALAVAGLAVFIPKSSPI